MAVMCEDLPFSAVYERLVEMAVRQLKELLALQATSLVASLLSWMPEDTAHMWRARALVAAACDELPPSGATKRGMASARRRLQELRSGD